MVSIMPKKGPLKRRPSTHKIAQAIADRRFEDADVFVDDYFEPRRANEGISSGRIESYSQICTGPAALNLREHGEVLMFYGRILSSKKTKLVPKAFPIASFICSNEGFKHSDHERDRFKCWPILGPCYGKAKAYGRSFCPVGERQWASMIEDVATMHELHPEILRSRRSFANWLVGLLLAFEIYQAEYERRAQAFIKAMTDFDADSQDEGDGEEPSFDQDGEDVPDPEDPAGALLGLGGSKHRRRVFLRLASSQVHTPKKVQCACCQEKFFYRLMQVAHWTFPASHLQLGDRRKFTSKTDPSHFRLECGTCNFDNGNKSGVVHAHNHQVELGLPGWANIRSMNAEGRWRKFAPTPPWQYGSGWRAGLIPKPTVDEDGEIVSWALRPDTLGGMFSVDNDGTFSQDPVLAGAATPSPNTRRQSPRRRAEEEETGDEEEPSRKRQCKLGERKKATLQSKKRKDTTEAEDRQKKQRAAKARRRAHFQGRAPLTPQPYI